MLLETAHERLHFFAFSLTRRVVSLSFSSCNCLDQFFLLRESCLLLDPSVCVLCSYTDVHVRASQRSVSGAVPLEPFAWLFEAGSLTESRFIDAARLCLPSA